MITIKCINTKTGKPFQKEFDDARDARIFYCRCVHGTNVSIYSIIGCEDYEELKYVEGCA